MKLLEYMEKKTHGSREFPVELYHVDAQYPQYIMPCHWHEECELIAITKGSFAYDIEGERGRAHPGDVLFVNSGALHAGIPDDCVYKCVVFRLDLLLKAGQISRSELTAFAEGDHRVMLHLPMNQAGRSIVDDLIAALEAPSPGHMLHTQGLLFQLFGYILDNGYYTETTTRDIGNQKKIRQLKSALALIENYYALPLTLKQLADATGMSPKYFCHFFRRMTQRSPIEYLNDHRVEVARHRLSMGHHSVTDVAYDCGFNDLSYFIRVFKRHVGITPKQYAASVQNAQ